MEKRFTLFVDESGEAGIERVRTPTSSGASPYMTLGAAFIANDSRDEILDTFGQLETAFSKSWQHCANLNHYQIIHFSRMISRTPMRLFGVISRKETLRGYGDEIGYSPTKYYNKCTQYLLERVGWFLEVNKIPADSVDIVFERANIDYQKMRNFLQICQRNPRYKWTERLRNVEIGNISEKDKNEEPMLRLADLVAHALYKCVDKGNRTYGIVEPRYFRELGPRFFGDPLTKSVARAGLYCVHSTRALGLDDEVKECFDNMIALERQ